MNTYILTILSACIAAAVIQLLSPKGEGGKLAEHIRMIAGLFLLVILLIPLKAGLDLIRSAAEGDLSQQITAHLPTLPENDYQAVFDHTLTAVGQEEVKAWVVSVLDSEFGIPPSGCTVSVTCVTQEAELTLIDVRISLHEPYMTENPHPIEAYVTERLSCPCYVTVGI